MTPPTTTQSRCLRACSACSGDYEDPEQTAETEASDACEEEGVEEATDNETERSAPHGRIPVWEE